MSPRRPQRADPNTLANATISIARLAKSAAEAIGENFSRINEAQLPSNPATQISYISWKQCDPRLPLPKVSVLAISRAFLSPRPFLAMTS